MFDYHSIKSYDELVTFQRMMTREYPFYPVEKKDWNKLFPETITVEGLKQIPILKKKIVMGEASKIDIVNYLDLLNLYICNNPTLQRLRDYQKENTHYFYSGLISWTERYDSEMRLKDESNLVKLGWTQDNKLYDKKLSLSMANWGTELIQHCYKLREAEN